MDLFHIPSILCSLDAFNKKFGQLFLYLYWKIHILTP
jgi:hypothetical protein